MFENAPWRLKSQRAIQHLSELDSLVYKYLDSKPFTSKIESWDGTNLITLVDINGRPDPSISSIVGDILHNQISTLDTLYFELIKFKAGDRTNEFNLIEKDLYFPILDNQNSFDSYKGISQFGDEQLKRALLQFQPFQVAPIESDVQLRNSHYYKQLKAFSNLDKHRGVNITHMIADDITLFHHGDIEYIGARKLPTGDSKILRHQFIFDNPNNSPEPQFDVKISLALETPPGYEWITSYSASSLLHTIQSQNNWAISVAEYILNGGSDQLIANIYT